MWREMEDNDEDLGMSVDDNYSQSTESSDGSVFQIDEESPEIQNNHNYPLRSRNEEIDLLIEDAPVIEIETSNANINSLRQLIENSQTNSNLERITQSTQIVTQNIIETNNTNQINLVNNDPVNVENSNLKKDIPTEEKCVNKINLNESTDSIADSCLICCEPYTSTSNHRVVALKCGHLFGKDCIEKWIQVKESKKRCPKCNQPSNKNDIRVIYAKTIVSVDTTERDQAIKNYEEERDLRKFYEHQVEELKFDLGIKESENIQLRKELASKEEIIKRLKVGEGLIATNLSQMKKETISKNTQPFKKIDQIDLKIDGCRLLVVSELLGYLIITQPTSPQSLMKGFGVRRIPLNNFKTSDFIFLHEQMIKDMALHSVDALLLTASFDKTIKILNLISKAVIATFSVETRPWCITWHKTVSNLFYVGLNSGIILECCTTTKTIVSKINTCLTVPIKSVKFVNYNPNTNRIYLLITSINASFFGEIDSTQNDPNEEKLFLSMKALSITGGIISTNIIVNNNTGHLLLSVRPSSRYQKNVQHYLINFEIKENEISFDLTKTFLAGSKCAHMIVSSLYQHPDNLESLLICSGDEDTPGAIVWSKDQDDSPVQKILCNSVVFDSELIRLQNYEKPILVLLTERVLHLYKWDK